MGAAFSGDLAIRTVGLTRHYGGVKALQDLNLCVPYGAVVGFLGRNGAWSVCGSWHANERGLMQTDCLARRNLRARIR